MDYTTLLPESQEGQEQPAKEMQSLYQVCQQVVDGREARGKRYELAGLLVVLVLAKLAGMQSLSGASDWVQDQGALLREGLQLPWKRMPCANTYSYALARLDRKPRECHPGGLVRAQRSRKPLRRGTEPVGGATKRTSCPPGH